MLIDRRLASGVERLPILAAELVAQNVDVIVAITTPAALAAKAATDAIPIVFVGPSDPVGSGLVSTLARPGANVTGMTDQGVDLAAKRLELLKQLVPRLKRVVALGAPADPVWEPVWSEVQIAARRLGIDMTTPMLMMTPDQLRALFADLDRSVQALYVAPQAILWVHREEIVKLAARAKLPAVYEIRDYALAGGLISYGTDYRSLYRDAARYVDRIFKGARPGDLPVEQPREFELVINVNTAKTLGVTIPQSILVRTNELIQ